MSEQAPSFPRVGLQAAATTGRRRPSMTGRLARDLALGIILLWLVAVGVAGGVVRYEMNEVFDSVLAESAQHMMADILDAQGERLRAMAPGDPPVVPAAVPHAEYITWQLLAADGRLVMRSHGAPETAAHPLAPDGGFTEIDGGRAYVEPSPDGAWRFLIMEPPDHRGHAIRGALLRLLLPGLGLVAGALLLVPLAVRHSLAPVRRLQAEIGRRGGANLAEIPSLGLPAELHPIRADVNLLLARLRQAMAAERQFTANAAHELRTPVAAAMAQAQLLSRRLPEGHEGRRQAEAIAEELRRLGRRVEKLLQLGRAEAGVAQRLAPVDLLVPLELLVEEHAAAPGGARLRFEDGGLEALPVRADLDMLAIALRNLLENALLHGDPSAPVTVRVTPDGAVSVVSGGPALPPDRLAALGGRFVRHGEARGSGLGLAIVRAVAAQGGGALELHSPARGRQDGFEAVLQLPLA